MSDQHNYLTTLDVLHDLIQVNGLRVCGYQPIIENRSDAVSSPWYVLLDEIICQSQRWQDELEVQVVELTGDLPANRGGGGELIRLWDTHKHAAADAVEPLEARLFSEGESALLQVYEQAAESVHSPMVCKQLIASQLDELMAFYDQCHPLHGVPMVAGAVH